MKNIIRLIVLLLLIPINVFAQTTSANVEWDVDQGLSRVSDYARTVIYDGTALTTVSTCVAVSTILTRCSVALPPVGVSGTHTIIIIHNYKGNEARTTHVFSLDDFPLAPKNIRIILTTTTTIIK